MGLTGRIEGGPGGVVKDWISIFTDIAIVAIDVMAVLIIVAARWKCS